MQGQTEHRAAGPPDDGRLICSQVAPQALRAAVDVDQGLELRSSEHGLRAGACFGAAVRALRIGWAFHAATRVCLRAGCSRLHGERSCTGAARTWCVPSRASSTRLMGQATTPHTHMSRCTNQALPAPMASP